MCDQSYIFFYGIYFYYEKDRVTILDYEFLTSVHKKEQAYVMYADSCALSDSDLQKWNITFKKIPRDIEHIQKGMRYGIKKISVTGNK